MQPSTRAWSVCPTRCTGDNRQEMRHPNHIQIRFVVAMAALLAALSPPARAEERIVNFYDWSNYMAPGVLEDYTRESGVQGAYETVAPNETLDTRPMAGKSGYDFVVPTAYSLQRQIPAHVFQK